MNIATLATPPAGTDDLSRPDDSRASASPSLYERLGKAPGIEAIVGDIIALHLANPLIKARFATINLERLAALKKTTCDFFGAGSGGPEVYAGKDLFTAHKGMNISEQELVAAIDDVVAALDKNSVGQNEKNEIVAILYSLKNQVLRLLARLAVVRGRGLYAPEWRGTSFAGSGSRASGRPRSAPSATAMQRLSSNVGSAGRPLIILISRACADCLTLFAVGSRNSEFAPLMSVSADRCGNLCGTDNSREFDGDILQRSGISRGISPKWGITAPIRILDIELTMHAVDGASASFA